MISFNLLIITYLFLIQNTDNIENIDNVENTEKRC